MNREVFITCAVTGAGDTAGRSDKVPVMPAEIAAAAIEAAREGAAIAHIHVRDPATGKGARDVKLYREVVDRIRDSGTDVVLNLTAGMGGDLTLGSVEQPLPPSKTGTDMAGATERLQHVAELLPEICTLDCGTMNFGEGDYVMTNTPAMLKAMAGQIQALGVRPEIEVFDTGHLVLAKWLVGQGLIDDPVLIQLCMGIPWGAPDDIGTLLALVNNLPPGWIFSGFSIGRTSCPMRRWRCSPAAMCGSGWRTTFGSARANSRPTARWSSARPRSSPTWAPGCLGRTRSGRSSS
jgi:uncharacterized protein (DUF849 family)